MLSDADAVTLRRLVESYPRGGINRIVFDLSDVRHINSTGIGGMLHARRIMRLAGGELMLAGVHKNVEVILERTGLRRFFPIAGPVVCSMPV